MAQRDQHEHLIELVKEFDTAMLVSQGLSGNFVARPMAVAGFDEVDESFYFFTHSDSEKVQEIEEEFHVVLAFMSTTKMLSLSGMASLSEDRARMQEYWREAYKVWFPDGLKDSRICLIRVEPTVAEYWDMSGLKGARYLFKSVGSLITGKTPSPDIDEHGEVKF